MSNEPVYAPLRVPLRSNSLLDNLRMTFASFAFRFMLKYVVILGAAVFAVMLSLYASYSYRYFSENEALIGAQLDELSSRFEKDGVLGEVHLPNKSLFEGENYYLLVDTQGHKVAGNLEVWPEALLADWAAVMRKAWLGGNNEPASSVMLGSVRNLSGGYRLLVARDYHSVFFIESIIGGVMVRSMLITIMLGALGGIAVGARSVRNVNRINEAITEIISGESQRIPVAEMHGDFRMLAIHFNQLLDQIQALVMGMRQVTDNVAHDLRTPLTRIRNHLASLQQAVSDGPGREIVQTLLIEADGLMATFNALLRIAQVESGQRRSGFRIVDLQLILADLVELYEPLAVEKRQSVVAQMPETVEVMGDRDLLFQAFANLLDNAIKYTPAEGSIRVRVWRDSDDVAVVEISDSGAGISDEDRDKVFRRFYRVETSRSTHPGNGLGLSLVKAVVSLHRANITLSDGAPGLVVTVRLPVRS